MRSVVSARVDVSGMRDWRAGPAVLVGSGPGDAVGVGLVVFAQHGSAQVVLLDLTDQGCVAVTVVSRDDTS
jgi:hypothetical protein